MTDTDSAAFTIARTIRDLALDAAATEIASLLGSASREWIAEVGQLVPMLGSDSLLVLDVAFADATQRAGERSCACKVGSRARRAHFTRFIALCEAHDLLLARVRELAAA